LIRVYTMIEQRRAEREAAAAGHPLFPPPEIVAQLREIARR
jgi:hypothetical protein